jgi:hypothetical protein
MKGFYSKKEKAGRREGGKEGIREERGKGGMEGGREYRGWRGRRKVGLKTIYVCNLIPSSFQVFSGKSLSPYYSPRIV